MATNGDRLTDIEVAEFEGVSLEAEPAEPPAPVTTPIVEPAPSAPPPVAPTPTAPALTPQQITDAERVRENLLVARFEGGDLTEAEIAAISPDDLITIEDRRGSLTQQEIDDIIEEDAVANTAMRAGKSGTVAVQNLRLKRAGIKPPTPEEIFEKAQSEGLIPKDATFVLLPDGTAGFETPETVGEVKLPEVTKPVTVKFGPEQFALVSADRPAAVPVVVAEPVVVTQSEWESGLNEQPKELRDAYFKGGIDAYNKAYDDWSAKHLFIGDYIIPIATWNQMPEKYQSIALREGYPAVIEAAEKDKLEYDKQIAAQTTALQTLQTAGFATSKIEFPTGGAPFEIFEDVKALDFDVFGYLRANPNLNSVEIVDKAGFSPETVESSRDYVETFQSGFEELKQDLSIESVRATNGLGTADPTALDRALRKLDIRFIQGSGVVTWRGLSDADKQLVYIEYADDPNKRNVFATMLANWTSIKTELNKNITKSGAPQPLKFAGQIANELFFIGPIIAAGVGDVTREEFKKVPDTDTFVWRSRGTGDTISNDEYNKLSSNILRDEYSLTMESLSQIPLVTLPVQLAEGTIGFIGGAIKARRTPEGIAQIIFIAAPLVKPVIVRGKVAFTGKVEVPLPEGPVTVWRGLKFGDQPLLGISRGRPAVGTRGITLPPLRDWELPGKEGRPFEPRTGVETTVLVNKSALEKAGITDPQAFVENIELTLSQVRKFQGKESPFMAPELLTAPIDTFSAKGVEVIMRDAVENKAIVDKIFGSTTMRPQLSPTALKEWTDKFGRTPGDIDIFLKNVDQAGAEAYAARLVERIKRESGDIAWISPDNPTLVRAYSRSTGANRHAIDIHYPGEPALEASITPSQFSEMVYGLKKSAPEVKVNLPGIGEISISRLSETGIGKTEQVLGWRRDPSTGEVILKTEAHRMKDYVDLFEIIKTYNGEAAAAKWAADIGITDILKQLEKEGKFVGAAGEFADIAWEFRPSEVASIGNLPRSIPTISIIAPAYISASRSVPVGVTSDGIFVTAPSIVASSIPSEIRAVDIPSIPPSVITTDVISEPPSLIPSEAPSPPSVVSVPSIFEPSVPPSAPPPSEPPSIPPIGSISDILSPPPSEPPSQTPPSIPPTEPLSDVPSIPPSEPPSEPPSPPVPEPLPEPEEPFRPRILPGDDEAVEKKKKVKPGTVVWIQGRPEGGAMYKILEPPYRDLETSREIPFGYSDEGWSGEGMAFKSIQVIGTMPAGGIKNVDLGFARVNIINEAGKPIIDYVQDIEANVGDRSRTVGMGDGQIPIDAWNEAKGEGVQFEDFVRTYSGPRVGGVEAEPVDEEIVAPPPNRSVPADTPRVATDEELMAKIGKQDNRQWWDDTSNLYPEGHPRRRPPPPDTGEPVRTYRGREILAPDLGGEI